MFNVWLGANGVNCPIGRHVFFLSLSSGVRYAGRWDQWPKDLEHLEHVKIEISNSIFHSLWIFMGLKLGWPCSKPMASRFDTLNLAVALPMERSVGRFGCVIFGCTSCGNKMRHCWAIAATSLPHHLQLLYTWGCCFWSSSYKDRCIKHNQ